LEKADVAPSFELAHRPRESLTDTLGCGNLVSRASQSVRSRLLETNGSAIFESAPNLFSDVALPRFTAASKQRRGKAFAKAGSVRKALVVEADV
jgi:hypothetical protein